MVADEAQGRGLGAVLAAALADAACRVGIRRFSATTLAENDAALRLLETLAVRIAHRGARDGVRELVDELPGCVPGRLAA